MTSLRFIAVLNVVSRLDVEQKSLPASVAPRDERARLHPQKYASATPERPSPGLRHKPNEQRVPSTDGILAHFASPPG